MHRTPSGADGEPKEPLHRLTDGSEWPTTSIWLSVPPAGIGRESETEYERPMLESFSSTSWLDARAPRTVSPRCRVLSADRPAGPSGPFAPAGPAGPGWTEVPGGPAGSWPGAKSRASSLPSATPAGAIALRAMSG